MRDTPVIEGAPDAGGLRRARVSAANNRGSPRGRGVAALAGRRAAGARGAGTEGAGSATVIEVPGAFEIPLAARRAAESGNFDAVVCLGCIVRGETPHFDYLASAVAHAIAAASQATGVPMTFGVLTTNTLDEAAARAGDGPSNKGREAALAAVQLANVLGSLPESGRTGA
ncbi:MAG: 6,7-dimethyl-8-ribityllumazine synthase [Acidobacteria bacterium]|nr:6,7-dimethyl-8-ribityllumazine synthase [Acidobacteriota bacterium]